MMEGQSVTPRLVGRNMRVHPLLVFVSLVFWLWLWDPAGRIVATPRLVWWLDILGHLTRESEAPDEDGGRKRMGLSQRRKARRHRP